MVSSQGKLGNGENWMIDFFVKGSQGLKSILQLLRGSRYRFSFSGDSVTSIKSIRDDKGREEGIPPGIERD